MVTDNAAINIGLLGIAVLALVQFLKAFLPASLSGDQRDAATRLLALGLGGLVQVAAYVLEHNAPQIAQALAIGAAGGLVALGGYHGLAGTVGLARAGGPAPAATPLATMPLIAPIEHDPLQAN